MTPEEAIKFNIAWSKNIITLEDERYKQALELGIEALKAVLDFRAKHPERAIALLPGETEE